MSLNTTGMFGIVRHPGMSFFIGVFFVTPDMVINAHYNINDSIVIYLHRLVVNYFLPSP